MEHKEHTRLRQQDACVYMCDHARAHAVSYRAYHQFAARTHLELWSLTAVPQPLPVVLNGRTD
jgi:hypothetical protein